MRRVDREITEFDEIIAVMQKCDVCRLALFDREYPYILPLNFGMRVKDGAITLYFHGAAAGKKYELIAKNNHVGFEMDCGHQLIIPNESESCTWGMAYESIVGQGVVEIVPEEEKHAALCALMNQYGQTECHFNLEVFQKTQVMKLTVTACTGKRRSGRT